MEPCTKAAMTQRIVLASSWKRFCNQSPFASIQLFLVAALVMGAAFSSPLHGQITGDGPIFTSPFDLAVEASGSVIVVDTELRAVLRVNPITGDRSIVSNGSTGSGPLLQKPLVVSVEAAGTLLVVDTGLGGLVRVNPITGDRTIVSDNSTGSGQLVSNPWFLPPRPPAIDYPPADPVFILNGQNGTYPTNLPNPPPLPWQIAISNAHIDTTNAGIYVNALKNYIGADMTSLIAYTSWDPANPPSGRQWYSHPWVGKERDPIHGAFSATCLQPDFFDPPLAAEAFDYAVVYYDHRAAGSLGNVWNPDGARNPLPHLPQAQFPRGGIVVKLALTTATSWPAIAGAPTWQIYAKNLSTGSSGPEMQTLSLFQIDIIVKDEQSAPLTGWVFSTLVYDPTIGDPNPWNNFVPLGAQWGNDPDVDSDPECHYVQCGSCPPVNCQKLGETWINQNAPLYSRQTLGWGGRLSGPNDGAVALNAVIHKPGEPNDLKFLDRLPMSSCMGCHGTARWEMTFPELVPGTGECATCTAGVCTIAADCNVPDARCVFYEPSTDLAKPWSAWFQDRSGTESQDPPAIALDYGVGYALVVLPEWERLTSQNGVVVEAAGDLIVSDLTLERILRVDPVTGDRTIVSDAATGSGPGFALIADVSIEATGDLVVADSDLDAVLRVDPVTGDRTIVSDASTGAGPSFAALVGLAVSANGDHVAVDAELDAVLLVDPITGDRTILSDANNGVGPEFSNPARTAIEASGSILVVDVGLNAVVRVDPVTGDRSIVSLTPTAAGAPSRAFALEQNFPNPFNPMTSIRFRLPKPGHVRLKIFNSRGEAVKTLVHGRLRAGVHTVRWDGRTARGRSAASGVYFYRLEAGEASTVKRMVLIR